MSQIIDSLKEAGLNERLFPPEHEQYKESLTSYWANQEVEVKPAYILRPQSAPEVARLVKTLTDINVSNNFSTPFAVRSGGHQTWPGSANIKDGLTIDLRALRQIEVNKENDSVTAGAGCYWEDVYSALDSEGRTLPGARVLNCGVAGLCLGGGISYFSPKCGFVCDNVTDFEIVLADGTITHANATANGDLFKALKGGSNNFGIVTSLTMRTFEQKQIWGGTMVYSIETLTQHYEIFHRIASSADYDQNAVYLTAAGFHHQHGQHVYNSMKYTEPRPEPPVFKEFLDIPSFYSTMRLGNLNDMVKEEGALQVGGLRRMFMTTSFYSNVEMMKSAFEIWQKVLPSVKEVKGVIFSLVYNPILPIAVRKGQELGGNSLGLDDLKQPLVLAMLAATWEESTDDKQMVDSARQLFDGIDSDAQKRGLYHPYKYMNYGWEGQKVTEGYGSESIAHLQKVSKKYDPHQIFQKAVPGGFKIPV